MEDKRLRAGSFYGADQQPNDVEDKRYPLKIAYPIIVKESDWTDEGEPIEYRLSDSNDIHICGQMKKNQAEYVCELFNRCKPDQQPNDVEAVKPIGEIISREFTDTSILYTFIAGGNTELEQLSNVYSQQTIDQLQEKIAEIKELADLGLRALNAELEDRTQQLADTEAKLKVADKALDVAKAAFQTLKDSDPVDSGTRNFYMLRLKDINQALDTIRKEQGDADKS